MLRLTRILPRKPPGFTSKLKSQPDNATTNSAANKPENEDPFNDLQKIVSNLQDKLTGSSKNSNSKDSSSDTSKSTTEEKEIKSIFGEKLGTKRKTVTTDKTGKSKNYQYEYNYEMDGNKTIGKIGQVIGFLFGFWLFKDLLPVSGNSDDGSTGSNASNASNSSSSPYSNQSTKPNELQYKNANEMYEQRQRDLQSDINAYNAQDTNAPGYNSWNTQESTGRNQSEGFSSHYSSSKFK